MTRRPADISITCTKCGRFFGTSMGSTREECYLCKPTRVIARTRFRGCPRCQNLFEIDLKTVSLKRCPECRKALAVLKEKHRQEKSSIRTSNLQ